MITSPAYSFVQFNPDGPDSCCNGINSVCLPVVLSNDLSFQVLNDSDPGTLSVVRMNGETVSTQSGFVSAGDNIYLWQSPIDITGLACDECFQLKIGTSLSNCFIKKCDDCFTSLIEYYNDEDYADFIYCNAGFMNRVRLPFYLNKPKMPETRSVYRKSNGTIRLTKSVITKQYTLTTDYLTEKMHDCLAVALGHDNTNIFSSVYSGGISKSGDYSPDWQDGMCIAQAELTVDVTPLSIRNNNCQECAAPAPPCAGVTIPSFSLPAATAGVMYNQSFSLGGTAPFTISNRVKPSWMTIDVFGNSLVFAGVPAAGDAGTGLTVSFNVNNECGIASANKTVNVVVPSCTPVGIVGTPSLPDGYVGLFYSYSFNLSGDANFTLGSIVKPSWMNISIDEVNKKVTLSGTPDAVATGVSVSFAVNNCADNSVNFSQTMNVATAVMFTDTTFNSSDDYTDYETANIIGGVPGATLTINCTDYRNPNGGTLKINGNTVTSIDFSFTVLLDSSGNGSFAADIVGIPNPGTVILGEFTINGTTEGAIGTPASYTISKVF